MTARPCPVCASAVGDPVLKREDAPVFCNVLWANAEEARQAATGTIDLRWCSDCQMLWNAAFDPSLTEDAPGYENSLHASSVFEEYAQALAERLVERYDLAGKTIVDVGSGRGEFLALLCAGGRNRGLGFDPNVADDAADGMPENVRLVRDTYTEEHAAAALPDFVSCRHVLEHVGDPLSFLGDLRRLLELRGGSVLYLEVPCGDWIVRDEAVWDVIYEHPSYFSETALLALLARAGFRVLDHGTSFGGQYLWAEATANGGSRARGADGGANLDDFVAAFGYAFTREVAVWERRLDALLADGSVALWGAGSKGITFLTSVPGTNGIPFVVDLSAHKHGRHVPLTGQEVVPAAALAGTGVRTVVAMNPLYADEIAASLADLGVDAGVVVA